MSTSATIPVNAQIHLLDREIEFIRFLNKCGKSDDIRAAAATRVLALQRELQELKNSTHQEGDAQ